MNGWTITIEASGDPTFVDEPEYFDDSIEAFLDLFADHGGSVTAAQDRTRYGATFSIDEPERGTSPNEIFDQAVALFTERAAKADLPAWPIVRAELMTYAEQDVELARPNFPELVGISEIAVMAGVTRQRASKLARQAGFPIPVAELKSGPIWTKDSLNTFLVDGWARKPGRPRKYCEICGGELEPWTGHGVGAAAPGQPLPANTAGTQHCTECDRIFPVHGDPWGPIEETEPLPPGLNRKLGTSQARRDAPKVTGTWTQTKVPTRAAASPARKKAPSHTKT